MAQARTTTLSRAQAGGAAWLVAEARAAKKVWWQISPKSRRTHVRASDTRKPRSQGCLRRPWGCPVGAAGLLTPGTGVRTMRLILLLVSATALQLQPRRDYIRGFNSAAPRAAPLATPPKGPVAVEFCPRRAVIASFAFGASQLLPAKRAVALRPKRRVAAAPPPEPAPMPLPTAELACFPEAQAPVDTKARGWGLVYGKIPDGHESPQHAIAATRDTMEATPSADVCAACWFIAIVAAGGTMGLSLTLALRYWLMRP